MNLLHMLLMLAPAFEAIKASDLCPETCGDVSVPETCGDVSVPYPFSINPGCYRDGFHLTCNTSYDPPKLYIGTGNVELINISLQGQARIYMDIDYICYNETSITNVYGDYWISLSNTYRFSDTHNKFTALGCDTLAYIESTKGNQYASGCVSTCSDVSSITNRSCSGIGCCQTSIPKGLQYYKVQFAVGFNHSDVYQFNPCSYAFLVDQEWYKFDDSDVLSDGFLDKYEQHVPLVLDWAVRDATCDHAKLNVTSYACLSNHSECIDASNGPGYICNCSTGYTGNPYIKGGCKDIDECQHQDKYPCYGRCINKDGYYSCQCQSGYHGDANINGGCQPRFPLVAKLVVGISVGIVLALAITLYLFMLRQKKKLVIAKQNFFEQNGGILLYDKMRKERGVAFRIFKEEELIRATNDFDKNLELGRGGHGTVYEGILDGIGKVAIKKAKVIDESQKEEFVREMVILSQVNHTNVVKLLGCCLEVEVPMLVYEYVSNGTLSSHIHQRNEMHPVPLDARLRIAVESAEALAYLHSSASPPILHGDVKSSNILLDDNYVTKVADFGASMLAAKNDAHLAEFVQGTRGYLDPEYLQTRRLTEKSDVYSFGVVLLELITGKEALYFEGSREVRSLALEFLSAMRQGGLLDILDNHVKNEMESDILQEFAELVRRCLSVSGAERPKMKEVAEQLHRFRKCKQHPWVVQQHNPEEMKSLLESSEYYATERSSLFRSETRAILEIENGR